MSLAIKAVDTATEREEIFAFRYRVYVEELGMTSEADHERKWLCDSLDDVAVSYAVTDGDEILGSLRVVYLRDVPDTAALVQKFRMEPAIDDLGVDAICMTSRFILDRRLRHGKTIYRLIQKAHEDAISLGARLNYGDCSPHLLPFYEHLGYRRYTRGYNDSAFGYKIPIVMVVGDQRYLRSVRSPLVRLENEDDPAARAWFEQHYAEYVRPSSAAFMPEELFFNLLTERVASDPLHRIALLKGLDRDEAQVFLSRATLVRLGPDDLVVRKGDMDDTLYVMLSGLAEVTTGDPSSPAVTVFGAGDTFGEIAFLTAVPRTANVVARTDCEVLVISGDFMERFIATEPAIGAKVLLNLSRELAGRLAVSTERAGEAGR